MATIVERPIAEDIEYRPPTQSPELEILAVSIPNFLSERPVNPNCKDDSRRSFRNARLPESGDCQGSCPRNGKPRTQQALKRFLSNRIKRKRLAARAPSSGRIKNNARQRQMGCFLLAGARTTDRHALPLGKGAN